MAKFELSISPDYVSTWDITDGVREIFQNALDQQIVNSDNTMFFTYELVGGFLRIGNKESVLDTTSLLLGTTTKRGDDNTIGQFGEGYKIAALVLLRLGKTFTIYNYGAREVWRARLSVSRKYNGAKILVFETDKKYFWQSVPDNNLVIEIGNITPEEHTLIVDRILHLQTDLGETIHTCYGRILLDERFNGHVYVNGLYICKNARLQYGYDAKPQFIKLDRDRKLVGDFDIQWLSSRMWKESKSPLIVDLARKDAKDVSYINSMTVDTVAATISDTALEEFKGNYGENAVPVTNQAEMDSINEGFINAKPVIVSPSYFHVLSSSTLYKTRLPAIRYEPLPVDHMLAWYNDNNIASVLTTEQQQGFERLLKMAKDWR